MTATIKLSDHVQAEFIAEMPELAGNGHQVDVDGANVTLTAQALAVLAELPEHNEGHYDGTHVWIGGTKYPVTR